MDIQGTIRPKKIWVISIVFTISFLCENWTSAWRKIPYCNFANFSDPKNGIASFYILWLLVQIFLWFLEKWLVINFNKSRISVEFVSLWVHFFDICTVSLTMVHYKFNKKWEWIWFEWILIAHNFDSSSEMHFLRVHTKSSCEERKWWKDQK